MTPLNYLEAKLQKCSQYKSTQEDQKILKTLGLEGFIYHKLINKKFRKWAVDPGSEKRIKDAIHLATSRKRPIQFTFPFGGYKLWSLPSQPTVDWAEFFTIAYYCEWLSPILSVYKPGAIFYFSSDDVIVERMDNIPKKDTDSYFHSFQKLLTYFRKYFVHNMRMELTRIADLYTPQEFDKELAGHMEIMKKEYEHPDPIRYPKMMKTSKLNICWKGSRDLTKLSAKEKEKMIRMGPIYHDAYGKMVKRRAFVRGEDKVVVFTTPIPNAIALGTSKTSITKFWTGIGVLEKREGIYYDRILSPEQVIKVSGLPHDNISVSLIDLPNFENIRVFPEKLNFS